MSNITKVTLKAIYNHDQWSLTTSINQNTNMSDGGDDDDCDGSVKSKQQGCQEIGDYCHRSPLSSDGSPT